MATDNITAGSRIITAFFDTAGAAKRARSDLVAAGIPEQHIDQTGAHGDAAATQHGDSKGFWESLKDFFLPDEDRFGYAEGLRRGGILLSVRTDEANYQRVQDILDTDGAVDMDSREGEWRAEGWTGFAGRDRSVHDADPLATGLATGSLLSAGASAPAVPLSRDNASASTASYDATRATTGADPNDAWRNDQAARAAALDGSVPATADAARTARRDDSLARPRVRGYFRDADAADPDATMRGSFSPAADAARITEHMEVISSDGQTIGTVDHLDGPDRIKLARSTSPDGQHHLVPFAWIDHVDRHVHLRKSLAEIKAQQTA